MDKQAHSLEQALLTLDRIEVEKIFRTIIGNDKPPILLSHLLTKVLNQIGDRWEQGEVSLSQVYMSGRICEDLLDQLLVPPPSNSKKPPQVAIAVLDDFHTLGKRIISTVLRCSGIELIDFHTVTPEELIEKCCASEIRILLISVLMYNSALKVKTVVDALQKKMPTLKIAVGGAPFYFDKKLYAQVGAHGMGVSSSAALALIDEWTTEDLEVCCD